MGDPVADQGQELREVASLVLATEDQHHLPREALQGLHGRSHVGSLGIVVVGDAVEIAHLLQTVRQSAEVAQAPLGSGQRHAAQVGDEEGRHDVLDVVRPEQRHTRQGDGANLTPAAAHHDPIVLQTGAVLEIERPAERVDARLQRGRQPPDLGIVPVQDGVVGRPLIPEDARLGLVVGDRRLVAVLMIGGQVQEGGDPGPEGVDPLELERRQLDDIVVVGRVARDQIGQRQPDVAAGDRLQTRVRQEVGGQRGRRALAVRPGDADQDALQEPRRQFDLTHHAHAAATRLRDRRDGERHAGAHRDQVGLDERARHVPAGLEHRALALQRLRLRAERFEGTDVGQDDRGLPRQKEAGHRHTTPLRADYDDAAAREPRRGRTLRQGVHGDRVS